MSKRTPEQKTQRIQTRMENIQELMHLADTEYEIAVRHAASIREARVREAKFTASGILRRYMKIANVVLHKQGKGVFHYAFTNVHNVRRQEIQMPTRAYVIPFGIELQFDWEDRGYTETSTRTVSWEDIFAYEDSKRDAALQVSQPCQPKTVNT